MNYTFDIPRWINVRELAEEIGVSRMAIYRARRGEGVSEDMMIRVIAAIEEKKTEQRKAEERHLQPAPAS